MSFVSGLVFWFETIHLKRLHVLGQGGPNCPNLLADSSKKNAERVGRDQNLWKFADKWFLCLFEDITTAPFYYFLPLFQS